MCAMSFTVDRGSDGYIATKQQKLSVKKITTNKLTIPSPYSILVYNKL